MPNTKKIQQTAVLAYIIEENVPKVMLVTSRDRRRWVLPKGHIDDGLSEREAAIQEAYEEAGINGRLAKSRIGTYSYRKYDRPDGPAYKVRVYPMEVASIETDWPEMSERDRTWMDFKAAAEAVEEPELKAMLEEFGAMLDGIMVPGNR